MFWRNVSQKWHLKLCGTNIIITYSYSLCLYLFSVLHCRCMQKTWRCRLRNLADAGNLAESGRQWSVVGILPIQEPAVMCHTSCTEERSSWWKEMGYVWSYHSVLPGGAHNQLREGRKVVQRDWGAASELWRDSCQVTSKRYVVIFSAACSGGT